MPQIIPIRDLKNTSIISKKCHEVDEPIFVTKNGYGDMVLMNMEFYEQCMGKLLVAKLVNDSIDDVSSGAKMLEGEEFFSKMRLKYAR